MATVIQVSHLSKEYRLGTLSTGRLVDDVARWWARLRGQEDPLAKIGQGARGKKQAPPLAPGPSRLASDPPLASGLWPLASSTLYALKDVSFSVNQGEVLGIIGRNGAGKSTLLKILSRVTAPSSGEVRVKGRIASLLEVGTGFHPELTGRENIFLNGAILGMTKAEIRSKFDEIVAFSEVEKFIDTPVKRYSSGMYVRLAFAVAAHLEPEILIVDEVLAVGDAAFQKKCLGKMQDVAGQGRTVLFVSHNMAAVRSLCQSVILLNHGAMQERGAANDVIDIYLNDADHSISTTYDLSTHPRPAGLGAALKIMRLDLNEGKGVLHGHGLRADITFYCSRELHDVSLGIGFSLRDGSRVLSIDSDIPGPRFSFHNGNNCTVSFTIHRVDLEPDTYALDIGARSGDSFALDYLSSFAALTIRPSDLTPAVIAMRASGRGGLRLPVKWMLHK